MGAGRHPDTTGHPPDIASLASGHSRKLAVFVALQRPGLNPRRCRSPKTLARWQVNRSIIVAREVRMHAGLCGDPHASMPGSTAHWTER